MMMCAMYFDDTTTSLSITLTNFDEDKTLLLNGKERLKFFAENYCPDPLRAPLSKKHSSLLQKIKRLLRK
jgi:hypothetical protein